MAGAYLNIAVELWVNSAYSQDDGESGSVGEARRDHVGDLGEREDMKAKLLVELLEFCAGFLIALAQDTAHGTATLRTRHLGNTYVKSLRERWLK